MTDSEGVLASLGAAIIAIVLSFYQFKISFNSFLDPVFTISMLIGILFLLFSLAIFLVKIYSFQVRKNSKKTKLFEVYMIFALIQSLINISYMVLVAFLVYFTIGLFNYINWNIYFEAILILLIGVIGIYFLFKIPTKITNLHSSRLEKIENIFGGKNEK